jgi:hypothetical protein
LDVPSEPKFALRCTGTKIYIDIVWSLPAKDEENSEPISPVQEEMDTTTPLVPGSGLKPLISAAPPAKKRRKKHKSPSTIKRDRRRRLEWLARKKIAGKPTVAKEWLIWSPKNLETPEVLDKGWVLPPPAFDDDTPYGLTPTLPDDDTDADLFLTFTDKPIKVCFCGRNIGQLKICTRCFNTSLCIRPKCKESHQKDCEQFKIV